MGVLGGPVWLSKTGVGCREESEFVAHLVSHWSGNAATSVCPWYAELKARAGDGGPVLPHQLDPARAGADPLAAAQPISGWERGAEPGMHPGVVPCCPAPSPGTAPVIARVSANPAAGAAVPSCLRWGDTARAQRGTAEDKSGTRVVPGRGGTAGREEAPPSRGPPAHPGLPTGGG